MLQTADTFRHTMGALLQWVLPAICAASLLTSCTAASAVASAEARPGSTPDQAAIAAGKQIYQARGCDGCHGLDAVGSTRTYAPTHNHLRATAEQRIHAPGYTGKAKTAAEYIRESIVTPKAYMVPGYEKLRFGMPSFASLGEREINALVQFLYAQE